MRWLPAVVLGVLGMSLACTRVGSPIDAFDRVEVWDEQRDVTGRYVLVHVYTTMPDYMAKVSVYRCSEGEALDRHGCLGNEDRLLFTEGLDGDGQRTRMAKSGSFDLEHWRVIVRFDEGPDRLIAFP